MYKVKVQLLIENDNGKVVKSNEYYLVDAVSPSDAETIVHKDFETDGIDFQVMDIIKSNIIKVLDKDGALIG